MKNNQFLSMLVGLLFLSTALSGMFVYRYNSSVQTLKRLQFPLQNANSAQSIMQQILNDTIEYSRTTKNPDIMRVLQTLNNKAVPPAK